MSPIAPYPYIRYRGYMDNESVIVALGALAQATRLDAFRLLVRHEPEGLPAGEVAKALEPVLGKPMKIKVNPRGAVVDVELGKQLKAQLAELAKVLGDFFSPDSIEQQLMTIGRLPAGPVSKGQSWMANVESMTALGKLSVARTFTYEGEKNTTDGSVSEIAIAGQLKLIPGTGKKDRTVTLREQQLTGVLRFDAAAGRLLESTEQQKLGIQTAYRELRIQSEVATSTRTIVTLVGP